VIAQCILIIRGYLVISVAAYDDRMMELQLLMIICFCDSLFSALITRHDTNCFAHRQWKLLGCPTFWSL